MNKIKILNKIPNFVEADFAIDMQDFQIRLQV